MSKVMLDVRGLTTKYVTRFHEDVYAVDHVSLTIEEGKSLGIAGESGCGKSTLALSLMGYYFAPLHYISGDIIIDGKNISGLDPDAVRKSVLGTEIAYIPQAAMNALNPTRKILRFIEDVIRAHDPQAQAATGTAAPRAGSRQRSARTPASSCRAGHRRPDRARTPRPPRQRCRATGPGNRWHR